MCFMQNFKCLSDSSENLSEDNFMEKQSEWNQLEKQEGGMFCHFLVGKWLLDFGWHGPSYPLWRPLNGEEKSTFWQVPTSTSHQSSIHLSSIEVEHFEHVLVPGVQRQRALPPAHVSVSEQVTSSSSWGSSFLICIMGMKPSLPSQSSVVRSVQTLMKQRKLNQWGYSCISHCNGRRTRQVRKPSVCVHTQ